MEGRIITAAEAAEFGEFKRTKREAEVALTMKKVLVDASAREIGKSALAEGCESAVRLGAWGVVVSPVNVVAARRKLAGSGVRVAARAGGTGESLIAIKKAEAKKAFRQGAGEIVLVPCYSALKSGNAAYLRREVKRVRRAVKKGRLTLSLEDRALGEEEISIGVRAACDGGADGVCVRGETRLVLCALKAGGGKFSADASCVENAEQLRMLVKAGAGRMIAERAERISEELYLAAKEEDAVAGVPVGELPADPSANPADGSSPQDEG